MTEATTHTSNVSDTKAGVSNTPALYQRYSIVFFVLFVMLETLLLRKNFLWKTQELDLFSFDPSYLQETIQLTGGVLRYVASFLTQFFYFPWMGTLLYILVLILLSRIVAVGFNLKKHLRPFSYIPVLAVVLTITELGYEVIGLTIRGYAFVVPLGVMALMAGFIWYRRLNNNQLRSVFIFSWTLLAYPLLGVYALMSTLLMLLYSLRTWSLNKNSWTWMPILIGLTSSILLPMFIRNTLFSGDDSAGTYTALLPEFPAHEAYLWLPYIILAVSLLVMVLAFPQKSASTPFPLQRQSSLILFVATLLMVHLCGNREHSFFNELAMERAYSSEDWQEVLRLSNKMGNDLTEISASYTELSRYKLGLMDKPSHVTASPFSGALLYYEYGNLEETQHWCLNQASLYGMNAYLLKYLTLAARSSGNFNLATKYNQALKGTLFYRKWALDQTLLIEQSMITTPLP
jgi:Family of unknown function (DUF6057)